MRVVGTCPPDPANSIEEIHYKGKQGLIVAKTISDAISIHTMLDIRDENLYCNIEFDDEDNISDESKVLFEHILMNEPGYLRYDSTNIGVVKGKEGLHPHDHFDINFSHVTYKLGLSSHVELEDIVPLFDKTKIRPRVKLKPENREYLQMEDKSKFKRRKSKKNSRKYKRK